MLLTLRFEPPQVLSQRQKRDRKKQATYVNILYKIREEVMCEMNTKGTGPGTAQK